MVYITTTDSVDKKKKRITGRSAGDGGFGLDVVAHNDPDTPLKVEVEAKNVQNNKLINNIAFTGTVTGTDINLSKLANGIITATTGAVSSGSPTLTVRLQIKDSNGNYIDYLTLPTITTANTSQFDEFYFLPFTTGRLVATFGGSGGFNNTTVELQAW